MTNLNYLPNTYIMTNILEALLRLKAAENRTFKPWVPVLSYQVERKCDKCWWNCSVASHDAKWVPCRELAILAQKGLVTVDTQTGQIESTAAFDSLASQVLNPKPETYPPEEVEVTLLGHKVNQICDENWDANATDTFTYYYFERDESDSLRLRSRLWEEHWLDSKDEHDFWD